MRDELKGNAKNNECLILNLDHSDNIGTHWVSLFMKNGICYYFDSFGFSPPLEVIKYLNNISERYYNSFKIQNIDEVICGHLCIYVLYRLSFGDNFYDILDELYKK